MSPANPPLPRHTEALTHPRPRHARPATSTSFPWVPDQRDGTFRNPVLFADYSDPDVIRVGDDFYLTASSFNCTPGLPILHSRDLVNWTLLNHAVRNLPHPRYAAVQPGCGIWAPSLRFHAGRFWIFFPMPDEGIYVTTADDPAAKWSAPRLVQAGKGLIDPCPLWDDDGQAFLVHAYAASRAGIKHRLRVRPMAPDASRLLGEGRLVFHAPDRQPTIEGPKFYKRDGRYYILAPAGGVATGWQLALRSPNVYGPYEEQVVLEQGSTAINGPHQGALVDTPDGEWWFVHFQQAPPYGRVVHLQPTHWHAGWPWIGEKQDANGIGQPVLQTRKPRVRRPAPESIPATSDEFDSRTLGRQWQWQANHRREWFKLRARHSRLRLLPQPVPEANLARAPNLLLQKFPAGSFAVETSLEFKPQQRAEEAGLVVMGRAYAALALRRDGAGVRVVFRITDKELTLRDDAPGAVRLRVEVAEGGLCWFSFATGAEFVAVPESFQAREGVWIGAKVGLYALRRPGDDPSGYADFDSFRFSSL